MPSKVLDNNAGIIQFNEKSLNEHKNQANHIAA